MKTIGKALLITVFFFIAGIPNAGAQTKYEFATVTQLNNILIRISIEGKPVESLDLPKEVKFASDHGMLFERVSKMQDQGWEVYSVSATGSETIFVLRKKKE